MFDIITFGSATRDIFARSVDFKIINSPDFISGKALAVGAGAKVYLEDLAFASGGGGTNAAATFALQGLKTAYTGLVGDDENGEAIIAELKKLGVGVKFIKKSAQYKTSQSIILSVPDRPAHLASQPVGQAGRDDQGESVAGGERSILVYEGACHNLSETDLDWHKIKKAKWFYISGLSGAASKVFALLINFAVENKIKLAVNPGHDQLTKNLPILKSLLNKVDVLLVNQEEACQITGVDYKNEEALFKKFDELVPGIAVMSKGKDGVAVSDGKAIYRAGIPQSGYVDRTGSGDAFGSGFVSIIVRGGTIPEAIQFGTANATATIQQLGAKNGLLKKGEWGEWERVKIETSNS